MPAGVFKLPHEHSTVGVSFEGLFFFRVGQFSKVSALAHLAHKSTKESTFENVYVAVELVGHELAGVRGAIFPSHDACVYMCKVHAYV